MWFQILKSNVIQVTMISWGNTLFQKEWSFQKQIDNFEACLIVANWLSYLESNGSECH